ncbi:MAG: hypothetical protein IKP23_04180 [Elusimicrobiaceae bacterium]|nr:hypothetical protein [Elusimicrobiaceae bacterium]
MRNQKHSCTPKTARYQARIILADPLGFACRVFAVLILLRAADRGCCIWVSARSSNTAAAFLLVVFINSPKTPNFFEKRRK